MQGEEVLENAILLSLWRKCPEAFFRDITGYKPAKQQETFLKDMVDPKNNRILLCSASGVGKTFTLGIVALWSSGILPLFTKEPLNTLIISGSLEQARVLYDYMRKFLKAHPVLESLIEGEPLKTQTEFKTGSVVKAIPASERAYYGQHPDLLIIDEAVLAGDEIIRDSFSRVAPSPSSRIILSSTPYDSMSLFVEMWERKDKYPHWRRYSWSAYDAHWIRHEAILEAQRTLPAHEFKIKWEGVPAAILGTVYSRDDIKKCIVEERPMVGSGPISIGIDWSYGGHLTAIEVVQDTGTFKNHLEEKVMRETKADNIHRAIDRLVEKYKPTFVVADASHIFENQRLEQRLRAKGIKTIFVPFHSEKERMIGNLRALIEQHSLRIFQEEVDLLHELANYTLDTKRGDDRHDALMLACYPFSAITKQEKEGVGWKKVKY